MSVIWLDGCENKGWVKEWVVMAANVKERVLQVVQELPPDATIADAMEQLYLLYKIEKGLQQAEAGRTVWHEEARERMKKWHSYEAHFAGGGTE